MMNVAEGHAKIQDRFNALSMAELTTDQVIQYTQTLAIQDLYGILQYLAANLVGDGGVLPCIDMRLNNINGSLNESCEKAR